MKGIKCNLPIGEECPVRSAEGECESEILGYCSYHDVKLDGEGNLLKGDKDDDSIEG